MSPKYVSEERFEKFEKKVDHFWLNDWPHLLVRIGCLEVKQWWILGLLAAVLTGVIVKFFVG